MLDDWIGRTNLNQKLEVFAQRNLLNTISPNQLTIVGFSIGILSAFILYIGNAFGWTFGANLVAGILMTFSFTTDLFDGALARVVGPTPFGGILDIFCDRAVEMSILLALVSTNPVNLSWPTLFALGAIVLCITIFLLSGNLVKLQENREIKKVIYYTKGIMERGETFFFLLVMVVVPEIRPILMLIFAILIYVTAFQRLWIVKKITSAYGGDQDKN